MGEAFVNASTPADGVVVLAFNRPAKRNALSQGLIDELLAKLHDASKDDGVRAIILTGSSSFFCGGSSAMSRMPPGIC
jgi:enoyl-CoA hydratase